MTTATTTIPQSVRDFLATGPLGHMVTIGPNGTPHVTLTWAGVRDDEIVAANFYNTDQYKIRNLRRDPRITISFQANEWEGQGLHPYLVVRGRASLTDGGALDVMDYLAQFYLGPGEKYPMRDMPPGIVIHVTPEKFYGMGSWREDAR